MARNILKILRSSYDGSTAPADNAVTAGEFAIAQGSKRLYIGRENTSGGNVEAYHLPLLTDLTANSPSLMPFSKPFNISNLFLYI